MSNAVNLQTSNMDSVGGGFRCPHLGLSDDSDTCISYPSDWNLCYKARSATAPRLEHQRAFCLSKEYTGCPVYLNQNIVSLPRELKLPHNPHRARSLNMLSAVLLGLLILTLAGLAYWQFIQQDGVLPFLPQRNLFGLALSPTPTLAPTKMLVTPTNQPIDTPTIAPTVQLILPVLPTKHLVCGSPLDTPIGAQGHFIIHQVADGQSMIAIMKQYSTTLDALEAVNYFIPKPIWVGYNLVIPKDQPDLSGIPTFQALEVNENDISIDDLAVKLSTNSELLTKYNELNPNCRTFSGWLLVVKAKVNK